MFISELKNLSAAFCISGPDANRFLGGQFTQEIRIPEEHSAYGLWLNQKGKVLGDSHIVKIAENGYWVFSEFMAAQALRQRLEDYLIADEVEIVDATEQWGAFLLWGTESPALFGEGAKEVLPEGNAVQIEGAWLFRSWGQRDWWWLVLPREQAGYWRGRLDASGAENASEDSLRRARILAGIPSVPEDIGADDLPNEGGLDATAISYTKGCYLGQEVMARLKNLGQVRRRLQRVRGSGTPPVVRAALYQGGRRVGELRSVAPDASGFVGLAMLSLVNFDALAPVQLGEAGPAIEVLLHG